MACVKCGRLYFGAEVTQPLWFTTDGRVFVDEDTLCVKCDPGQLGEKSE